MYINATGFYIPEARVDNQHFLELNGLTSEWIEQRTGIRTRSIAKPEENINTMSMEALRNALPQLPYDITEVDLIISASYYLMIQLLRQPITLSSNLTSQMRKLCIYLLPVLHSSMR